MKYFILLYEIEHFILQIGINMAVLKRIFVIHTTSDETNANTDASFDLIASKPGTDFVEAFKDLPHDERERDRTDEYIFNVEGKNIDSETTELTIVMRNTDNGWLPRTMWALGETERNEIVVLGAHPQWEKGWFDRGNNAVGPDRHLISN